MLLQRTEETEQLVFKTEILKSLSLSETNINKVFFGTNNKLYITVRETEVTDVYHFVNLCYGLTLEVDNIKISSPDNLELNKINFRANDITIENKCLNNCGILSDLLHLQNTIVTNCDIGVMWLNADWNTIQHINYNTHIHLCHATRDIIIYDSRYEGNHFDFVKTANYSCKPERQKILDQFPNLENYVYKYQ